MESEECHQAHACKKKKKGSTCICCAMIINQGEMTQTEEAGEISPGWNNQLESEFWKGKKKVHTAWNSNTLRADLHFTKTWSCCWKRDLRLQLYPAVTTWSDPYPHLLIWHAFCHPHQQQWAATWSRGQGNAQCDVRTQVRFITFYKGAET